MKIKGIIPPLVTPLDGPDKLDEKGLLNLINHVTAGGVHGIFILGTTGELSRLSSSLRDVTIRKACDFAAGRIPVLVGISETSMDESLKLETTACEAGADAVLLAPPFYYHVEQDELLDYFIEMADRCNLPLFLYNMPSRTNISISVETVVRAAREPGIVGIKDSSGDMLYLQKLLHALDGIGEFPVIVGPEEILAQSVLSGASGGINGGANLFPELYVRLYEAAVEEDLVTIGRLQKIVIYISSTLYQVGGDRPNYIKILKEALYQMGICNREMAKPYIPFSAKERDQISNCLEEIRNIRNQLTEV